MNVDQENADIRTVDPRDTHGLSSSSPRRAGGTLLQVWPRLSVILSHEVGEVPTKEAEGAVEARTWR